MGKKGVNFRQKNGNYKNGRTTERGYIKIRAYTHPFAPKRGYVRFHRYILEIYYSIKFGFPVYILPKWFDIHHKNGIRDDNRIENLELISHSKHTIITNKTQRTYKRKDYNGIICLLCGSDKTSYSLYYNKKGKRPNWYHYKDGYICHKCYNSIPINDSKIPYRECLLCNTNKTRINKKGIPLWLKYQDGYICGKCYDRIRNKTKRPRSIIKKSKGIKCHIIRPTRVCILCKTTTSKTVNRSMWNKYKNKFDICIKCNGYKRRKYNNPFDILDILITVLEA